MSPPRRSPVRTWVGAGLAVTFIAGFIYMVVNAILAPSPTQAKRVQQISLVMPPPPPPPPPVEQPPEPEIQEEVDVPEESVEADAPSSPDLGVDADGSGSGDGFGLVGKKGGRDLLDGNPFDWYAGQLSSDLSQALASYRDLRSRKYTVRLKLWIGADGRIEKVALDDSTGSAELDKALRIALADVGRVRERPPLEMPQPVKLRLTSRL